MKRIVFRGKCIDTGEWVYGSLLCNYDRETFISVSGYSHTGAAFSGSYKVLPDTVGQYTGLKDRKGKDVYENDIIEAEIYDNEYDIFWVRFLIVWDKRRLRLKCLDEGDIDELEYLDESEATIKVLGNKWDNPELLEDEK